MNRTTYEVSRPPFVIDWDSMIPDGVGHTIDWANVPESYRSTPGQVVKVDGAVAADATTLTVDAIQFAILTGRTMYFGQAGETVRVAADAAAGATSITIDPDHAAIEDNDEAVIAGTGYKSIPAGTRMGVSGTNGMAYPRVETTNPATFILATPAHENANYGTLGSYGGFIGGPVRENLLPGSTGTPKVIPTAEKTELAAAGCYFTFRQYVDTTA